MQSVVNRTNSRLLQFFRLRGAKSGIPSKLVHVDHSPPLFQRFPPWWARWTLGLVACDVFMTGSAIELTWNHWSAKVEDSYSLRPTWQRLGLCAAHLGLGVGVAVALIVAQARFVRTLAIISPSTGSGGRRVFIQCAHNLRRNGMAFPLNKCSLEEGRNETEMIFRVAGERGHWYIGLSDSVVNGYRVELPEARDAVLAGWGGKRLGRWTTIAHVDSRWKNGPVRRTS